MPQAFPIRPTGSPGGGTALDAPRHDRPLYGLAGLGVAPEFTGPGTGEGQAVGAHMVLAEHIAGDIHRGRAFAREIIQAKLPGQGLIA